MDPEKIDAQFDRAVEIVQGLPKTGPIQTGYEEKLAMYRYVHMIDLLQELTLSGAILYFNISLYKQGMIVNRVEQSRTILTPFHLSSLSPSVRNVQLPLGMCKAPALEFGMSLVEQNGTLSNAFFVFYHVLIVRGRSLIQGCMGEAQRPRPV